MQTVSSNLQSVLDLREGRDLVDLVELYAQDYEPSDPNVTFDPSDAVERFASIEITWNGLAYRRSVVSIPDVSRLMGRSANITLTFSNADENRYIAAFVQNNAVEGMWLVIRLISQTTSVDVSDSTIKYVGNCGKPGDFEEIQGTLTAKQEPGNINQKIPPRKFQPNDPKGRQPSDKLFEGFRFVAQKGSHNIPTRVVSGFFGMLFNKGKRVNQTLQYSSHADFQADMVVPMVFGRCQLSGVHVAWIDYGNSIAMTTAWCEGPIKQFINLRNVSGKFTDIIVASHSPQFRYGYLGGVGTQLPFEGGGVPGNGHYSRTAMTYSFVNGSEIATDEGEAPELASIIMGLLMPLASESFGVEDWSDSAIDVSRYILTNDRLLRLKEAFIDDGCLVDTASWCAKTIIDDTSGESTYIVSGDFDVAGDLFKRFRSTGIVDEQSIGYELGTYSNPRGAIQSDYRIFLPHDPPGDPIPPDFPDLPGKLPVQRVYRTRYTCNVPITDEMPAIDFLNNVIFPSAKLYMLWSGEGKLQIKSEKAADSARIKVASVSGASTITVDDVTPWKNSLQGLALVGAHLTTSEVRKVTAAGYSSSTIPISRSVTGGITATLSGATISGGTSGTPASATVTLGGTSDGSVTLTIGGYTVSYELNLRSTLAISAQMIAGIINANRNLRKFVEATASGNVVTITSKLGDLTLGPATTGAPSALINAHKTSLTQPTTAPSLTASSGDLSEGDYYVCYSFERGTFETDRSSIEVITLTEGQQITTGSVTPPSGATVNWYVSRSPGATSLGLIASNNGSAVTINSYPEDGAREMPQEDMTAEEVVRIAMAFASNNQDNYPSWQASKAFALNDIVLPTTPNGRKYKVTTAGMTASSEPVWPTTSGGTVTNGSVVFTEFGATILGQAGLTRGNIYRDTVKWPLGGRSQSYNQFKGKYREAKDDFALTPIEVNDFAHQKQVNKVNPLEVDLSAVDNHDQASRLLNAAAAKYRDGDEFLSHKTHARAIVLEEGDVYTVSDSSGGFVNYPLRAEELKIGPAPLCDVSTVGRKYSSLMYADRARAHVVKLPTVLRYVKPVDTVFVPLDIPVYRELDRGKDGIYAPVNRPMDDGDWRGAYIYSDATGAYVAISDKIEARNPIGVTTSTLTSAAHENAYDSTSTVRVQIATLGALAAPSELTSTTDAKLLKGANLCAVGAHGRWELGRFKTVALVSGTTDTYDLTGWWRGDFNTEGNTQNHTSSDTFVLLTDADGQDLGTQFIEIDPSLRGETFNLKGVTVNQNVADGATQSILWADLAGMPRPATNFTAYNDASGTWAFNWQSGEPKELQKYLLKILNLDGTETLPNGRTRAPYVIPGVTNPLLFESEASTVTSKPYGSQLIESSYTHGSEVVGYVRSILTLTETGWFIEFSAPPITGDAVATYIAVADADADITNPNPYLYIALTIGFYADDPARTWVTTLEVKDRAPGVVGLTSRVSQDNKDTTGTRYRMQTSGSETRIYRNYTGVASEPLFVSKVALPANLKIFGFTEAFQLGFKDVVLGGLHYPYTTYSVGQQEEDETDAQANMRVRVQQVSSDGVEGLPREVTF